MGVFSAGTASVQLVPDFSKADTAIHAWFAGQGDVKVKVSPDLANGDVARIEAELNAMHGTAKVEVDKNALSSSISTGVKDALALSGLDKLGATLSATILPAVQAVAVGLGTELVAAASQAAGAVALIPAALLAIAVPAATVAIGVKGIGDAFKALDSGNLAKINEAMGKLAPSARDFVTQIHALGPAWTDLHLEVQQTLFAGLGTSVSNLASVALPVLKVGLDGVANAINVGLLGVFSRLRADAGQFPTIFSNITLSAQSMASAMAPLADAFVRVANIGSQFLPQIAAGFFTAADAADKWVQKAQATGQLTAIIQNAITVIDQLGKIAVNVGSLIGGIFTAALPFGNVMLKLLVDLTGQLATFAHSAEGQTALTSFFSSVNQAVVALVGPLANLVSAVVTAVLPAIGQLAAALAPVIGQLGDQLAAALRLVGPLFGPLAQAIGAMVGALSPLIPQIGQIVATLLPPLAKILADLAPVLGQITALVATALLQAVQAIAPVLPVLGAAFVAILQALVPLLPLFTNLALQLLPPLLQIVVALAPVLVGVAQAFAAIVTAVVGGGLAPVLGAIANTLSTLLVPVLGFLADHINIVIGLMAAWATVSLTMAAVNAVQMLGGIDGLIVKIAIWIASLPIVTGLTAAWGVATTVAGVAMTVATSPITLIVLAVAALAAGIVLLILHWNEVVAFLQGVWNAVVDFVIAHWQLLVAAIPGIGPVILGVITIVQNFGAIWQAVVSGLKAAWDTVSGALISAWNTTWGAIQSAATTVWNAIASFFTTVWGGIQTAWSVIWTAVQAVFSTVWGAIQSAASAVWGAIVALFTTEWNGITAAWSAVWSVVQTVFSTVWNGIQTTATTIWNGIVTVFTAIWKGVTAIWTVLWDTVKGVFTVAWTAIQAAATAAWNAIAAFFTGAWAAFSAAWSALWNTVTTFVQGVWNTISGALQAAWNAIVSFFTGAWNTFAAAWSVLWTGVQTVLSAAWNAITGVLTAAWNAIASFFTGVWAVFSGAWSAFWNAVTTAAQAAWAAITGVLQAAWNAIVAFFTGVWAAFSAAWSAFWNAVQQAAAAVWAAISGALQAAWNAIASFFTGVWAVFSAAWSAFWNGVQQTLSAIWGTFLGIVTGAWNGVVGFLQAGWTAFTTAWGGFWDGVSQKFNDIWNGIKGFAQTVWNDIKAIIAVPINFVIGTILNGGLFKAWNAVNDFLGLSFHINDLPIIPGFAKGGYTGEFGLFGTGDKEDPAGVVHAREFVFTSDQVDNAGGPAAMYDLAAQLDGYAMGGSVRKQTSDPQLYLGSYVVPPTIAPRVQNFLNALSTGQAEAVQAAGGFDAIGPGFFYGGAVDALTAGKLVAQFMNGKPYIWGGAGPDGADCSGFQSIITNALRGANNPFSRVGTTADFPWAGFTPGLTSAYAVGSIKDAGGGIGHMAGTLAGVNVESGGSHGNVAYGGPAAGADAALFNIHASLPQVGGAFAGGGAGGGGSAPATLSILGNIITGAADVLKMLTDAITGPISNLLGQSPGGTWLKVLAEMPKKLLDGMWGMVKDAVGTAVSNALAAVGNALNPANSAFAVASTGPVQDQVKSAAHAFHPGWEAGAEWSAIDFIVSHESSWNPAAQNPTSTASGLFQEVDSTWAEYRSPNAGQWVHAKDAPIPEQAFGGLNYISSAYGDPVKAQAFWAAHSFFDTGGWLPPGSSTVFNGTGSPELVLNSAQQDRLATSLGVGSSTKGAQTQMPLWQFFLGSQEITDMVDARLSYRSASQGRSMRSSR